MRFEEQTPSNIEVESRARRAIEKHKSSHYLMLVVASFMTVGDGILTPALSVLSASSGLGRSLADISYQSEALAEQVTKENLDKSLIYPPFSNIRKISGHIAAKAYELGLATRLPRCDNLVKYAESCMYTPNYRSFR
ncbi:NADP-dependent malic enzyme-like isoform X1 [Camellia sinensis]|uniref:NADP-dependent malic enzyme-like isoform X1 n=1 Tax=Camellia sinensis TaxID=4442 RepID=UPI001035BE0B|nr:NADP-dependent malic enzyme-like isoform X1 [Camellia sinensis]